MASCRAVRGQSAQQDPLQDGLPVLAVFVADNRGRWSDVVNAQSDASNRLCELFRSRGWDAPVSLPSITGFGVVRGWHVVRNNCSTSDLCLLASAAVSLHPRRQSPCFLEHEVLEAGYVDDFFNRRFVGNLFLPNKVISAVKTFHPIVHVPGKDGTLAVNDNFTNILPIWSRKYGVNLEEMVVWSVVPPIAHALANGHLSHDLSVIWNRQHADRASRAPVPMSERFLSLLCKEKNLCMRPVLPPTAIVAPVCVPTGKQKVGSCESYQFETLLDCVQAGLHLRNQSSLSASAVDMSVAVHRVMTGGSLPDSERADIANCEWPSKRTMHTAILKLDFASMWGWRDVYVRDGPFFRFVSFDASPQRPGIEVFASSERAVRQKDVYAGKTDGVWPSEVMDRRFPLALLGQGRAGLTDKVSAHCHQSWLDYGSSLGNLRAAHADVRGVLSDMGVELGIGDYADILDDIYPSTSANPDDAIPDVSFLYPFALVVPGPQHTIDNVFKTCVAKLSWWKEWVAQSKVACQWLAVKGHRDILEHIIVEHSAKVEQSWGVGCVPAMKRSIERGCDKFAAWRWKTVYHVTTDLLRMADAVIAAVRQLSNVKALYVRDTKSANTFLDAASSDLFWCRTRVLNVVLGPLSRLSSWIRGCKCHETLRSQGKAVDCKWGGCRAVEFAAKLRSVEAELRERRDTVLPIEGLSSQE